MKLIHIGNMYDTGIGLQCFVLYSIPISKGGCYTIKCFLLLNWINRQLGFGLYWSGICAYSHTTDIQGHVLRDVSEHHLLLQATLHSLQAAQPRLSLAPTVWYCMVFYGIVWY